MMPNTFVHRLTLDDVMGSVSKDIHTRVDWGFAGC